MGVPMLPFVIVTGVAMLIVMWGVNLFGVIAFFPAVIVYLPLMSWMRFVTTKDDQRLRQVLLRVRLGAVPRTKVWGGARSYALVPVRKVAPARRDWEQ
jgi:type IV secretion system protein VirB3